MRTSKYKIVENVQFTMYNVQENIKFQKRNKQYMEKQQAQLVIKKN